MTEDEQIRLSVQDTIKLIMGPGRRLIGDISPLTPLVESDGQLHLFKKTCRAIVGYYGGPMLLMEFGVTIDKEVN